MRSWWGVTTLGDRSLVWLVLGCALIVPRRTRRAGAAVLIALAFCTLVVDFALKPLVARPRPFHARCGSSSSSSPNRADGRFPRGIRQSPSRLRQRSQRAFPRVAVASQRLPFLLAILIACSRLYLFVHFPTDVLAGAALGAALGIVAARVLRVLPHPSHTA